jgi:hypothetical protein
LTPIAIAKAIISQTLYNWRDYASYCLGAFPALLSFITGNVFLLILEYFSQWPPLVIL